VRRVTAVDALNVKPGSQEARKPHLGFGGLPFFVFQAKKPAALAPELIRIAIEHLPSAQSKTFAD